jgi:acetyltransferase-like isoleucine patch superfamily enzyme
MGIYRFIKKVIDVIKPASKKNITIGKDSLIARNVQLNTQHGGIITIGKNFEMSDYSMLLTCGGNITIGDDCSVNPFCILYGHGGLIIGNQVRIAAHTVIIPANHSFENLDTPIMYQNEKKLGIKIGNNVWIGNGVRILDGVTIGNGVVVAAGSIVNKNIPDLAVVAGVPAKIIKMRKQN